MKVNTVNVIQRTEDSSYLVMSFSDDEQGNKEAEELFTSIVKSKNSDAESLVDYRIDEILENGYYEIGEYELSLVHS